MATQVQRRRGTTTQHATFTGELGETTIDTDKKTVIVHDGAAPRGFPLLREDFSNNLTPSLNRITVRDYVEFDTDYEADGNEPQGSIYWNADERTLSLVTNGVTIEMGQKLEVECRNNTGSTIAKGAPVYATGTIGNSGRITVAPMIADGSIDAKFIVGVTDEAINNGEDGKVVKVGKIRKINTTAYDEGDVLYVSPSVAGGFTTTKPTYPEISLPVAFVVTESVNVGEIFVRVEALDENRFLPIEGVNINETVYPSSLSTDQDDYDVGDGTFYAIVAFPAVNITGFAGGVEGRVIELLNVGRENITLKHADSSSLAVNRIESPTGADVVLGEAQTARLRYVATTYDRWYIVGGTY